MRSKTLFVREQIAAHAIPPAKPCIAKGRLNANLPADFALLMKKIRGMACNQPREWMGPSKNKQHNK